MKKFLSLSLIVFCSCSKGIKRPTAPSGTMSQTDAALFMANEGQASLQQGGAKNIDGSSSKKFSDSMDALDGVTSTTSHGYTALATTTCTPQITGTTTDSDLDLIPVDKNISYDCEVDSDGINFEMKGKLLLRDTDDTRKDGGFYMSMEDIKLLMVFGATNARFEGKGSSELTIASGIWKIRTDIEIKERGMSTLPGQEGTSVTTSETQVGYYFDSVFTPTVGAALAYNSGTLNSFSGFVKVKKSTGLDVTLQITGNNITYSNGCGNDSYFQDGEVNFVDGSGNITKVIYSGCTATYTYNGTAITVGL